MTIVGAFEIIGIRDAGDLNSERLLLRAIEPASLEYYIVVNVKSNGGKGLTILNDKVFWFPVIPVNTGEYVRLYTKTGSYNKQNALYDKTPAIFHNFYWGLNASVWGGINSNAVSVFKVNSWNTTYQT
ncbi:MAG: hypothetical protein Q8N76_01660 [Candidatus Omnitrophota bacterium]|nr:hypothetical protein [Candidatus Omnitrophota bacterium]